MLRVFPGLGPCRNICQKIPLSKQNTKGIPYLIERLAYAERLGALSIRDKDKVKSKVCPFEGRPLMLICPKFGTNLSRPLSELRVLLANARQAKPRLRGKTLVLISWEPLGNRNSDGRPTLESPLRS